MADGVAITPGSGVTVASDDIGGVQFQRVKNTWGPDGTATDVDAATGLPVQSGYKELTGSAAANNTDLVSADVSGYRAVSVSITGTFTATVTFQQSADGTNWVALPLVVVSTTTNGNSASTSATSANMYAGPIQARYIRFRTTSYTSGTPSVIVSLWANAPAMLLPTAPSTQTVAGSSLYSDATNLSGSVSLSVTSAGFGYNGATWDRLRTPTTFKSAAATASGSTAVWTPGASKKFRLLRYKIDVTQDAAQSSGGVITVALLDNATDLGLSQSVFVPGTAATAMGPGWTSGWIDLGNGRLSSTINQLLNVSLSAALTSGTVRVVACGVEE